MCTKHWADIFEGIGCGKWGDVYGSSCDSAGSLDSFNSFNDAIDNHYSKSSTITDSNTDYAGAEFVPRGSGSCHDYDYNCYVSCGAECGEDYHDKDFIIGAGLKLE